ncbi:MAG: hypothetical protein ACM3O6_11355 [Acidobacteriota bacterium]
MEAELAEDIAATAREEHLDAADIMRRWLRLGRDAERAQGAVGGEER